MDVFRGALIHPTMFKGCDVSLSCPLPCKFQILTQVPFSMNDLDSPNLVRNLALFKISAIMPNLCPAPS